MRKQAAALHAQGHTLEKMAEKLEPPSSEAKPQDKKPTPKPPGITGADLQKRIQEDEERKKPKHW